MKFGSGAGEEMTTHKNPWTNYRCAVLSVNGRLATNGEDVRLRIADFKGEELIDVQFDLSVGLFREVLAAARLMGISEDGADKRVKIERDDPVKFG